MFFELLDCMFPVFGRLFCLLERGRCFTDLPIGLPYLVSRLSLRPIRSVPFTFVPPTSTLRRTCPAHAAAASPVTPPTARDTFMSTTPDSEAMASVPGELCWHTHTPSGKGRGRSMVPLDKCKRIVQLHAVNGEKGSRRWMHPSTMLCKKGKIR